MPFAEMRKIKSPSIPLGLGFEATSSPEKRKHTVNVYKEGNDKILLINRKKFLSIQLDATFTFYVK